MLGISRSIRRNRSSKRIPKIIWLYAHISISKMFQTLSCKWFSISPVLSHFWLASLPLEQLFKKSHKVVFAHAIYMRNFRSPKVPFKIEILEKQKIRTYLFWIWKQVGGIKNLHKKRSNFRPSYFSTYNEEKIYYKYRLKKIKIKLISCKYYKQMVLCIHFCEYKKI